ncbi:hypothetical protein [Glycomyces algeriensis]|nr:hypothetical protein [Glycomyces algeriensis]MDA1368341.1 hypothetical protein [Glycomyces algeriensis]MDR7351782.1 hypothetical protein [Glycomyces algeriensis]
MNHVLFLTALLAGVIVEEYGSQPDPTDLAKITKRLHDKHFRTDPTFNALRAEAMIRAVCGESILLTEIPFAEQPGYIWALLAELVPPDITDDELTDHFDLAEEAGLTWMSETLEATVQNYPKQTRPESDSPAEPPVGPPVEVRVDLPVGPPAATRVDPPVEPPAGARVEPAAEPPVVRSIDRQVEDPIAMPVEQPVRKSVKPAGATPAEPPAARSAVQSAKQSAEQTADPASPPPIQDPAESTEQLTEALNPRTDTPNPETRGPDAPTPRSAFRGTATPAKECE